MHGTTGVLSSKDNKVCFIYSHLFSVDAATCLPAALAFPLALPLPRLVLPFTAYDTSQLQKRLPSVNPEGRACRARSSTAVVRVVTSNCAKLRVHVPVVPSCVPNTQQVRVSRV